MRFQEPAELDDVRALQSNIGSAANDPVLQPAFEIDDRSPHKCVGMQ